MTHTLSLTALRALLPVASTDSLRPELCGIRVEVGPDRIRYTASDGCALLMTWHPADYRGRTADYILPSGMVKAILRAAPRKAPEATATYRDGRVTVEYGDSILGGGPVLDETYPDMDSVIPKDEVRAEAGVQIDPKYLAPLYRAAQILGSEDKLPQVVSRLRETALVVYPEQCRAFGLVMPRVYPEAEAIRSAIAPAWAR